MDEEDTFRFLKQVPFEVLLRDTNLMCAWISLSEDAFEIYSMPFGWTAEEFNEKLEKR